MTLKLRGIGVGADLPTECLCIPGSNELMNPITARGRISSANLRESVGPGWRRASLGRAAARGLMRFAMHGVNSLLRLRRSGSGGLLDIISIVLMFAHHQANRSANQAS